MRTPLFIAAGALAAFITGLAGTYVALPSVAPGLVVDGAGEDTVAAAPSQPAPSPLLPDASGRAPEPLAQAAPPDTQADSDSLRVLREKVRAYEAQMSELESELGAARSRQSQAEELAATLVKLEDRELARVVDQLDIEVLEALYGASSARNQARLLSALSPSRAAVFIQRATGASPTPQPPAPPEPAAESELPDPMTASEPSRPY